jgi:hypothetical protein
MSAELQAVLEGRERWCVLQGDCRDWLPLIPDMAIDHAMIDAPYSEHVHGKQKRILSAAGAKVGSADGKGHKVRDAELGFDALTDDLRDLVSRECGRLAKRWVLSFSDVESNHLWRKSLSAAALPHIRVGAWIKVNGQPQLTGDRPAVGFEAIQISHRKGRKRWNWGGLPAVWAHPVATDRNGTGERFHTTQKPITLMLDLIDAFTDPGDLILDCFAGASTTGAAAVRLGRRFIGIELNADYVSQGRERLQAEERGMSLSAFRAEKRTKVEQRSLGLGLFTETGS